MADEPMSIGEYLKRSRLARRLDIAEISQELHIRREYLEALESDQWDTLPGEVYGIGFLRSYARFLDVDAESLVGYRRQLAQREAAERPAESAAVEPTAALLSRRERKASGRKPAPPPAAPSASRRRAAPPASAGPSGSGRVVFGAAFVLIALFVVGMVLLNHHQPKAASGKPTVPSAKPTKAASPSTKHPAKTKPSPSGPTVHWTVASNDAARGDVVYQVAGGPLDVHLTFTGQCWVEVWQNGVTQNSSGHTYYAGQSLSLSASKSVEVWAGTRAYKLTLDSQAVTVPDPSDRVMHVTFNHS